MFNSSTYSNFTTELDENYEDYDLYEIGGNRFC